MLAQRRATLVALAALALLRWRSSSPDFALPEVPTRQVSSARAASLADGSGVHLRAPTDEDSLTQMNSRYVRKPYYEDGWRVGGRNMWIEDRLGGNWMNITALKQYTYPSGRLMPRVMTKLRMTDHKRAMRYIKRMRMLGLMPYHRLLGNIGKDPAAKRPPFKSTGMTQ
ncbi:unnamed protein product, partial [Effrenium voratum]